MGDSLVNESLDHDNAGMSTTKAASPDANRPKPIGLNPDQVTEPIWYRLLPVLFCLIAVALLVGMITLIFGMVSGEEFSPDSFERRSFRYHRIPLMHWQVTPITYKGIGNGIESTISNHAPELVPVGLELIWDLSIASCPGKPTWQGDAKILCDLLDANGEKRRNLWERWSDEHPLLADEFWPVVVDVAQARAYLIMPELFELAQSAGYSYEKNEDDDKDDASQQVAASELKASLRSLIKDRSIQLAEQFEAADEDELAFRCYQLAIEYGADAQQEHDRLLPDFENMIQSEKEAREKLELPLEEDEKDGSQDTVDDAADDETADEETAEDETAEDEEAA